MVGNVTLAPGSAGSGGATRFIADGRRGAGGRRPRRPVGLPGCPSDEPGARRKARFRPRLIAGRRKDCYLPGMEELFGDPAYKGFVLQDKKRLPARFFARVVGSLTSRFR